MIGLLTFVAAFAQLFGVYRELIVPDTKEQTPGGQAPQSDFSQGPL